MARARSSPSLHVRYVRCPTAMHNAKIVPSVDLTDVEDTRNVVGAA